MRTTSFLANQTILRALDFTLAKGGFSHNANLKTAASDLIKELKSTKSVSGRHQQIMGMLRKGATLKQMMKATGSSRRTIFRYLNHVEDAGTEMVLSDGKYKIKK